MGHSFFDMLRLNSFTNKISRITGANFNNPSLADKIIHSIFGFPYLVNKKSTLFKNKYVCTDAAIISMLYAIQLIESSQNSNNTTKELMCKCLLALRDFYKVPTSELRQMWKYHTDYFLDLILDLEDIEDYSPIAQEAALLFTYDIAYNKYVEFNKNMPVLITEIEKQFMIEQETNSYFKVMIPMIKNICNKE